jgi:multidrug resistance efflux pump
MTKRRKIYLAVLGVVLLLILSLKGHFKFGGYPFSGTLEFTEHSLGSRVPGRLATLLVDEGDEVKKGQLLATLDRYEQTKKDYERAASLLKEGGSNEQAVEYARLALEDQEVISPVDGVILLKVREPGEVLAAGSPVVVVGDRSELWVRIFIPEGYINRVRINQPAVLRFDGLKRKFKGHVSYIATKAEFTPRNVQTPEERVTQTFAVKIMLDGPAPFLHPGVSADVKIDMKAKTK